MEQMVMADEEMIIITRTFDLLVWLVPMTNHFPRAQRHTFTRRLLDSAFDFWEGLNAANHSREMTRADRLADADEALTRLRGYLRLAERWQWLTPGQYQHVARMMAEIGRLLGGWLRATRS